MSRAAVILRNVATNWLGFVIAAAITLLLTPYVLHTLGTTRYGIWVLTFSVVGYYGILDLGFRAGLTQHLTRQMATKEYTRASEYLSTSVAVFLCFGTFLGALSIVAAALAPRIFDIPPELASEAFWCILIVGLSTAFQYALFPFAAIFPAMQRFDIANFIGIGTRLVTAGGIVFALKSDYGLVGVSAATCAANVLDYIVRWRLSLRVAPFIEVSRKHVVLARMRDIFSFGVWNFLISINYYAYQHVPNIIIAGFMRLPAVGHYALATGLSQQVTSVLTPIGQVMYPAAAGMHAQRDHAGLKRLYHDGSRLMMLAMISVVLIAGLWAEDFYRLWIGEQFLQNGEFHSVALLLRVLLVATVATYVSNIGAQVLMGAGYVRTIAITLICGSALSLVLSTILVQGYGLLGIALAVVISSAVVDTIVIPIMVQRLLHLSIFEFLRYACVRPLAVGIVDTVLLLGIRETGHVQNWWQLILQGAMAGAACAITAIVLGMTRDERERFLFKPFRTRVAA